MGLDFGQLKKTFHKGPYKGDMRLVAITNKIDESSPFEIEGQPDPVILNFRTEEIEKAFREYDLDGIAKVTQGRVAKANWPFIDGDENPYKIQNLKKTNEFGGQDGGGTPPDPHELMTGALILKYGNKKSVPKAVYASLNAASQETKDLMDDAKDIITSEGDRNKKIEAFPNHFEAFAQAVSAADAFLGNIPQGGKVLKVYGTGRQWAGILTPYRIQDHIFMKKKDYNSSDLIVLVQGQRQRKVYVGVSLKKKKINTADPTIINKTVIGTDGLLQHLINMGAMGARKDWNDVYQERAQFFYNVIEKALTSTSPAYQEAITKLGIRSKSGRGIPKKIENYKKELRKSIKPNLNTAAKVLAEAQKLGQNNMTLALKHDWPYGNKLQNADNIYFRKLDEILTNPKYSEPIVLSLVNIIFKTDLKGYLGLRGRSGGLRIPDFKFTLITGEGNFKNNMVTVGKAHELQEVFTTNLLTHLLNTAKNQRVPYAIRQTKSQEGKHAFEAQATAAKLFYTAWIGQDNVADLEIRYKGSIRSEPQFFAVITPHFKQLYTNHVKQNKGHKKW